MTDQTQDIEARVNSYLDVIESSVTVAGDFMVEQTPLVVQEYLAWYYWESVFFAAVFLLVCLILAHLARNIYKKIDFTSINSDGWMSLVIISGTASIMSATLTGYHLMNIIKITIAPRVVLLEKISDLMP